MEDQNGTIQNRTIENRTIADMDAFTRAYVACALWSSTDNANESGGEPLDANYSIEDIAPHTLAQMIRDCQAFQRDQATILNDVYSKFPWFSVERAGHDFWLTRNGHGAGFWDETVQSPELWKRLTDESKAYGSFDLYVGSNGKIDN